ncbi:MAG: M20 metallopeptidase family protein, partial [Thermoanaerobaculia bacterium]
MLREGALADPKPEAIFALHSFPELADGTPGQPTVGKVGWTSGPTYAAVDHFPVTIRGKQSHGAYPHLGVDPIVMAAQAVTAFQTIRSRTLPALEPSVVTVGIIRGGERFNIIPGEVHLEGTVRTYKTEVRSEIERRMREILDGVARAFGGAYELDYRQNAPATVNDPELAAWARPVLERAVGAESVVVAPPTMGGEDFAYFADEVPGFYFRLGTLAPGTTSGGLHTPDFRADDSAVPVGIKTMARLVAEYLTSRAPSEE